MRADGQDDWALLARATVDRRALQILFERHKDYVYRLARTLLPEPSLADDVVQSVFLRLRERPFRLQPNAKFTTWLYQFALNVSRETGRRHSRAPATARVAEIAPDELAEDSDNARINLYDLQKALARLPERQREIFILRCLEGFSTRETAEIAGCGEGTVKTHLARAVARVEAFFKGGPDRRPDADIRINELHLTGEST